MVQVAVAGHVNWDVTLRLDRLPAEDEEIRIRDQRRAGGGSTANVAAALSDLDVSARVIGSVGDDEPGRFARDELAARGVDMSGLRTVGGETTVKYMLVGGDGEVAVLGNDGVNEAIGPDDVDPADVTDAEHLHLTGQRPATAAKLARIADEAGLSISVDPGRRGSTRDFSEALDRASIVFATRKEAKRALDRTPAEVAADGRTVVVTEGPKGATLYADHRTHEHAGFAVDVVDTSGAGDAFAAGFLSIWLDGSDDHRALAVANACGALASTRVGARVDINPTELQSLLDDGRIP